MPFRFQVLSVQYEDEQTVITGHIMAGEVGSTESVILPTTSGQSFRFRMVGMQAPGPDWPIRAGHPGIVELVLGGHPPKKDVVVPCVAIADGKDLVPTPNFALDYGCEFYEGDGEVIGAAISAGDWQALRNGSAARSFVGFPRFIHGEYFDWFAGAVASVLEQPEVPIGDLRTVAGESGHWLAGVLPVDWVAAVASVPAKSIGSLSRHWRQAYLRQGYCEIEDWPDQELLDPLYRLTILCAEAVLRHTDLVLLAV